MKLKQESQPERAIPGLANGVPIVILVGRANAGKSTLFNRITRRGRAIVSSVPGTTRDLNMLAAEHDGRRFVLVDSGGLELGEREGLSERVVTEALKAVATADVVVFVVDGRAGLSPADAEALALIREVGRPTLLAVNKLDSAGLDAQAAEFHTLGVDGLFAVSAAHGRGLEELLDAVVDLLPPDAGTTPQPPDLRVALIGRPNAGKSSLLNRLVGSQRSIVDATPGTTRDPVDVRIKIGEREADIGRYCGNPAANPSPRRVGAALGQARDRNHPPGRGPAAGGGRQRGDNRSGRAAGAAGRK